MSARRAIEFERRSGRPRNMAVQFYNAKVTIAGIPEDAERYLLGPRSALAWIIDRYQVGTDKASRIVNDPNDW